MISTRACFCALLLLAPPAFAQTAQMSAPARPIIQAPLNQPSTAPAPDARPDPRDASGASQTPTLLPNSTRQGAENARISTQTEEARANANQRMSAANTALATGIASGASQMGARAPAGQAPDIETLVQQTLSQSSQEADADLRETTAAMQRENQRRRALREASECLRNAANANQCPCPANTQRVDGRCVSSAP